MSHRPLHDVRGLVVAALLLAFGVAPTAAQQTGRIQGSVVASGTQQPLAGVQVHIPGTGIGTLTNPQGQYQLANVPVGQQTVRVQILGYSTADETVTVTAGAAATANFVLEETAVALDEIVVTGTAAETRKKEVGNSMAAISARDIENVPVTSAQEVLAGRAPGVTFMANSGQPGAGGTVKIRGINSISQDAEPLLYIDGVRVYNEPTRAGWGGRGVTSPLQDISQDDIERVEIVKGAAATTLYGTEAANGVIQIFTKKGAAGDPLWTAEVSLGAVQAARWSADDDPTGQYTTCGDLSQMYGLALSNNAFLPGTTKGQRVYFQDPTCPSDGTWEQTGMTQRYALSVRGGSERVTYFVSGNYGDSEGYMPTQGSKDGGFRVNTTFAPSDVLNLQLNNSYQRRNTRWLGDGNNAEGFLLNVGRGPAGYMKSGKGDDCAAVPSTEQVCATNAYMFDQQLYTRGDHYTSGLTINYNPTDQLSNRFVVGFDYLSLNNETTLPFGFLTLPQGYYWDENTDHTKVSLDYAGSFRNNFGESLVSTFSWGGQIFRDRHRWTEIDVQSFAGPGEPTLESGAELTYRADEPFSETNAGFFLQEQLGLSDRLFVTAGLRVDGNSAFGDDFGLQTYPKISASYVISDHAFWPDFFETMKLRAAVGESGKAPGAFDKVRSWSSVSGDDGSPGFTPNDIGNNEVGPERTREVEAGFDASMLNGRFGVEFTAFQARTFDALVPVDYPPSSGFTAARTENVGEILNKGLELGLTFNPVRTDNLDLRFRVNGTLLKAEAIDIDGDGVQGPCNNDDTKADVYTGLNSYIRECFEFPMYFGARMLNPNEFAAPQVVEDTVIGRVYPNKTLGLGTTISLFNNLTLDALIEYQGGHTVQNYSGYQSARRGAWHPCFPIQEKIIAYQNGDAGALNDVRAIDRGRCAISSGGSSDGELVGYDIGYWTEDGEFIKMRQIALTYQLPAELFGFARNASITLAGRNLFTLTDYTGADPEGTDGADALGNQLSGGEFGRRDYYQLPSSRTFSLTARVTF